jgi:hypothetical protein
LLRSLQEIQPDFVEEAKAYAGLWSQGEGGRGRHISKEQKINVKVKALHKSIVDE